MKLRDNQALRAEIFGHVTHAAKHFSNDIPQMRAATDAILDAVDRALTATGPGSDNFVDCETCGQPRPRCIEAYGKRRCNEPSPPHTRHNADGVSWTHPPAAPQTDHRAAPPWIPVKPDAALDAATPPSGSPPAVTEACTCFHAPEQHEADGCGVFTLMNGPCPCEYDGRRPPESPDGSRGTR